MPKLEARNTHPMFALDNTDAHKIATEVVRRAQAQRQPAKASEKAVDWARKLWDMKQHEQLPRELYLIGQRLIAENSLITARECSRLIDALKQLPSRPKAPASQTEKVTDGFYMLHGDYVKVQEAKNGSGRLYAKMWDGHDWEYLPGLVRKLTPEMKLTAEQAKKFGSLYGCCIFCSRDLTDERSIESGYGPICAKKRGLPWG